MKIFKLVILVLVSVISGLHLLILPNEVHPLLIRGIGLLWIIEGINYSLELLLVYKQNKLK